MSDLNAYRGDIIWRKGQEEAEKKFHSFIVETFTEPKKSTTPKRTITWVWPLAILALMILLATLLSGCGSECFASESKELTASYYSIESLKEEGTYAYSNGQMANGHYFRDGGATAASWDYPLGQMVRVTNPKNGRSVIVEITDRTARRFKGKRIDLAVSQFAKIADLRLGLTKVIVEVI